MNGRRVLCLVAISASLSYATSTERAGNLFSGDEDIALRTNVSGPAHWTLTNDYGERIVGAVPVVGGRIHISTYGLRYGRYTFGVEGDGEIVGGVVPPVMPVPPDLAAIVFAPFQLHWNNPEEALLWKQLGAWEVRFEYGFDGMNPAKGEFRFDPAIDRYMRALADHGVRPSFKINGAAKWNDPNSASDKWGEPVSYDDYEEGVRRYARHYARFGMDRYYIINEPEAGGWWTSGWDGYLRFLRSSYKTLKGVDSRILVIAPNMWSFRPGFADPVLLSGNLDIFTGHYTTEKIIGNVHGYFYLTRMRKTGVILPFINGEEFSRWRSNLQLTATQKNYPGITPSSSVWGVGPVLMATLDTGAYRVVGLHLMEDNDPGPFAKWEAGNIVLDQLCFEHRAASDEFAGAQYRRRLVDAPPTVLASLFRRGYDNYLGAYVPVGELTQLLEISTSSPRLRIVDVFGNEQFAEPVDGKVRLLLTNAEVYVHGLGDNDTFAFLPHAKNEPPEIVDPGGQRAAVGLPFRLTLNGRDPDANLPKKVFPTWKLIARPEGMTVRAGSGLIEWLPRRQGRVSVTVGLADVDGATAKTTFLIEVGPKGTPLPPYFVSRPPVVAVKGGLFRYAPLAVDERGGEIAIAAQGPDGMSVVNSEIVWRPREVGVYPVTVKASAANGAVRSQQFDVTVCPNPDRPNEGVFPPREPTMLSVTRRTPKGITLVWNPHSFARHVIQRSLGRNGSWQNIAVTDQNWFRDSPPSDASVYYRVCARNEAGDSEATPAVNGRNRAPISDAGPSRKMADPGKTVLDGSGSYDPEGKSLNHFWRLVNSPPGSRASLGDAGSNKATLVADRSGRYVVELLVNDGEETSLPDYAWVIVGADPMEQVAYAGPDRFAVVGETVPLSPVAASPATREAKWFWRWDHSPLDAYAGIHDNLKRSASLLPETPGVYQIQLWPLDDRTFGYPDVVRIIVGPTGENRSAH